jgi:hypothetical protein
LSQPPGSSHGGRRRASRALRGPSERPAAALDPTTAAAGRHPQAAQAVTACRPAATLSSFRQSIPQESVSSGDALRVPRRCAPAGAPHWAMVTALVTGRARRTAARLGMLAAALTADSLHCSQLLVRGSPANPGQPDRLHLWVAPTQLTHKRRGPRRARRQAGHTRQADVYHGGRSRDGRQ